MTKTCGKCGHAALDDHAQFCNRCGAVVPQERKPSFPVCPACGAVVSDELAQYCNRCGTKILPLPVVCSGCGNPAIDNLSRFCTRCGTTFEQKPVLRTTINCPSCGAPDPGGQSAYCDRCGAPFNRQGIQPAPQLDPAPVIVTQRKTAGPLPLVTVPDTDWEPWNDVPPAIRLSGSPGPAAPEQPAHPDQQIAVPKKRYAHIPLVADEMKTKGEPGASQKKSEDMQKKGVRGFMKK